jgi:2-polyprenyl-6-methoxyphenol hydroxylase-like FAD-dependent oxidoreductase
MSTPGAGDLYDVIVVGAGPIGQTVADRARAAGLTVVVVERELARRPLLPLHQRSLAPPP